MDDKVAHVALEVKADQEGGVGALVQHDSRVARRRRDQVELRQLHVGRNVDAPPLGPVVHQVVHRVANCEKEGKTRKKDAF